jgi:hypothetical protein
MSDSELKTVKIKVKLGSLGDQQTEYWTEEDWANHRKYCKKLKEEGRLGKVVEITTHFMPNPLFDDNPPVINKDSFRMIMLDMSKGEVIEINNSNKKHEG